MKRKRTEYCRRWTMERSIGPDHYELELRRRRTKEKAMRKVAAVTMTTIMKPTPPPQ